MVLKILPKVLKREVVFLAIDWVKRGGGVKGLKNNLGLFCREFYTESAGFYLMSKFQAVFEILRQTYPKKGHFRPRKIPKIGS